jgi:hypothetical protein
MKTMIAVALATLATVAASTPADARDGCGRGYHRNYNGHCVPNWRQRHRVVPPGLVIHRYYSGRGYWDGHRYWQHRRRWNNRWRYY